jgi:hypothetical protein
MSKENLIKIRLKCTFGPPIFFKNAFKKSEKNRKMKRWGSIQKNYLINGLNGISRVGSLKSSEEH